MPVRGSLAKNNVDVVLGLKEGDGNMMSQRCVLLAFAGLCLSFVSTATAGTIFTASLSGAQEIPPVVTDVVGNAQLELSDDQSTLSYVIDVFGLDIGGIKTEGDSNDDITGVHFHAAPAGENGPVVFGIFRPQQDQNDRFITINGDTHLIRFEGVWDAADVANGAQPLDSQLANLFNEGLYVNVHTVANLGGEVRGQIVPEPSALTLASLTGFLLLLARRRWR